MLKLLFSLVLGILKITKYRNIVLSIEQRVKEIEKIEQIIREYYSLRMSESYEEVQKRLKIEGLVVGRATFQELYVKPRETKLRYVQSFSDLLDIPKNVSNIITELVVYVVLNERKI